jgi:hypothetical protein
MICHIYQPLVLKPDVEKVRIVLARLLAERDGPRHTISSIASSSPFGLAGIYLPWFGNSDSLTGRSTFSRGRIRNALRGKTTESFNIECNM